MALKPEPPDITSAERAGGADDEPASIVGEIFGFMRGGKRFWLLPMLIAVVAVAAIAAIQSWSTVRSFIYPLL